MADHAILSPSASHRWLNCTAAPGLEKEMPDSTSVYAEEGSLAHAICEAKLIELRDGGKAEEIYRKDHGKFWTEEALYLPEMEDTSDYYRDIVADKLAKMRQRTPDAILLIEVKLDFSTWIPEGFGTADAVVIGDGEIDVIDYKHGKGVPVSSVQNPQMMTYASGACEAYALEFKIDVVTMTIVQPRIDNTSTWTIPYTSLTAWADEVLKPKAIEAYNGILGCKTTVSVGEWCRFCKAKAICRERANTAVNLLKHEDPRLLSSKEIAELLPKAVLLKDWCSDLEGHALALLMGGEPVEGYKVVEGRSTRKVSAPLDLAKRLSDAGVPDEAIYRPQELRTLTELERTVGKKVFLELAEGLIERPKGKPTLAPMSDKREPYTSLEDDFSHLINN